MADRPREFSDDARIAQIRSPLGDDALILDSLKGEEAISKPFAYRLEVLSHLEHIAAEQLLGQRLTVEIDLPDQKQRVIDGLVFGLLRAGTNERFVHYDIDLGPWLRCLLYHSDCRIFQEKTVPEILRDVFARRGFHEGLDFEIHATGRAAREYCVQYRETDFHFVSRLMEEEGLRYFFRIVDGRHLMTITDAAQHPLCPQASVPFDLALPEGRITSWDVEEHFSTGRHTVTDYNFETPSTDLTTTTSTLLAGRDRGLETFDFPGPHATRAEGDDRVRLRMEQEETSALHVAAQGDALGLLPGHVFRLTDFDELPAHNGKSFLVTSVRHSLQQGVGFESSSGEVYSNLLSCVPADVHFRPPRRTPKPTIQGIQTAVVTGPPDQEIYTDKYGRVKVHFPWDRHNPRDQRSSCFIRVSQFLAGSGFGAMFLPRIGQEVLVEFLEGDPDRPIITGRVYNAERMPPYALDKHKTRSTIKTRSTEGGAPCNFNEIRFEDKKGDEMLFVHAEKALDVRSKGSRKTSVGGGDNLSVGGGRREKVGGDRDVEVMKSHREKIGEDMSHHVVYNRDEMVGLKYALLAGQEIHLESAHYVVIDAHTQLSLKCGPSFIDIRPDGIFINGPFVHLNSGGSPKEGAGSDPDPPKSPAAAEKGC